MSSVGRGEVHEAEVTAEILQKWNGCVRVWDTPRSAVDGAEAIDMLTKPTKVTVLEVQKDMMYGTTPQRYRISYAGKEGWVLADAIAISQ